MGLYASARLGRAMLTLDAAMPVMQRNAMLKQSGCRLVLTSDPWVTSAEVDLIPGEELLATDQFDAPLPVDSLDLTSLDPQQILLIVPTSGTTSMPKGVMLSAKNLAASADEVNRQLGLKPDDCWLNCLPLSHIAGLSIAYRCSRAGAAMVLHQGFDAERVWHDLEAHRVSHISLVPAMLGRLLEAAKGRPAPDALRAALIGGGPLDPALAGRARASGWPLVVSYGMTETASMCVLDRSAEAGLKPGCVGRPLGPFRLSLSEQKAGIIRVSGNGVMAGYVNPQLRPGDGLQDGVFETGDLGHWDEQGRLCVTGRGDEVLNSGGLRLHPREVEDLLEACPGRIRVGVGSRPDPLWGDLLVALYEGGVSEIFLEAWARIHLPSGLRPREFHRVESLPRNRMGKLDRRALKQYILSAYPAMTRAGSWGSAPRG